MTVPTLFLGIKRVQTTLVPQEKKKDAAPSGRSQSSELNSLT